MLAIREDVDYRVIYMEEQLLVDRLRDVYIAKKTQTKPPIFHEILEELSDIEATLFVKHHPEAFSDLTQAERDRLFVEAKAEDHEALGFIYARMNRNFVEMFARDLILMLEAYQYTFFERDPYDREYSKMYNASIQSIW